MEHGATRNFQAEKLLEEEEKRMQKEREEEEPRSFSGRVRCCCLLSGGFPLCWNSQQAVFSSRA